MGFQLKDVLSAIGPNAAIVFASWIFMSFLQSRYAAAFRVYRELIQQYRAGEARGNRQANVRDQVLLFKRRFELMRHAVMAGLFAAILLIAALIIAGLNVVFPALPLGKALGTGCVLLGFSLVIVGAALVLIENSLIQRALMAELIDVPDLAGSVGQPAGKITDRRRGGSAF